MKRILITGCSGFVGKNLLKKINYEEYEVQKIDSTFGDLSNPETWNNFKSCEYLIHLAAKTFVPDSWEKPFEFIKNNLLSTANALEFCSKNNTKLILLSSYMYGDPIKLPTPETHKLSANNPYGLSKLLSEEICRFYYDCMKTEVIILRVFNLFGPDQPENFLISKIISQIKNYNKVVVSSLSPKRDYLYIDDLISAIIKSLSYSGKHRVFNIGMGISYSVKEIIEIIKKNLNSDAKIENKNVIRRKEIMETIADIQLAKVELNWSPSISFEEGIKLLINQKI